MPERVSFFVLEFFLEFLPKNPIVLEQGSLFNKRYRIVDRLGCGSFGTVFHVSDTKEGDTDKVCKVIRIIDEFPGMHASEVSALQSCIGLERWPKISDHFVTRFYKTIVLSWEGESLSVVLARNLPARFSIANTLRVGYGILDALQILHTVGFLHRDISMENVMLKQVNESSQHVYSVVSLEGESISTVLGRNSSARFSIVNTLRLAHGIFDALQTLHQVGYLHRDVSMENVMLKRVTEGVVVRMIDLGNAAKSEPPPCGCHYNTWKTSIYTMKTQEYTFHDDLVSAIFLLIELSGSTPFDSTVSLLEAKKKFHRDPSTCLDKSRMWLGDLLKLIDELKEQKSSDMAIIWSHLENSIPEVSPNSPIEFTIAEGRVYVE